MHYFQPMPVQFSPSDAPLPRRGRRDHGGEPAPAAGGRIAIVEDELMVAWALESSAEDMGYSVTGIFADADAVLESLLTRPVELVLMDINLGAGMDGVETARCIRAAYGIPIIFISAYADAAMQARIGKDVPGARFLRKPVQAADLEGALRRALGASN